MSEKPVYPDYFNRLIGRRDSNDGDLGSAQNLNLSSVTPLGKADLRSLVQAGMKGYSRDGTALMGIGENTSQPLIGWTQEDMLRLSSSPFVAKLQGKYQEPNPPKLTLQDTFFQQGSRRAEPGHNSLFTYVDKDGNTITKNWTISDEEFLDHKALTQEQITKILNEKNPELVKRGFDKSIYDYSQQLKINPKVLLATLGQEQNWCIDNREDSYRAAYGVGPGGTPGSFKDGGLASAARTYSEWFRDGKFYNGDIPEQRINQDSYGHERRASLGKETDAWEVRYPQYARYLNDGINIKPVNAAMYSKLKYTPWVDYPPQQSHPLMDWHDIFRQF